MVQFGRVDLKLNVSTSKGDLERKIGALLGIGQNLDNQRRLLFGEMYLDVSTSKGDLEQKRGAL